MAMAFSQGISEAAQAPDPPGGRPLRILHVVHGLPRGGLERGVVNLANRLPATAFVQAVCCLDRRGEMADQIAGQVEIFELRRGRHDIRPPLRLARLIRAWRPDVVHCRNWNAWPDTVLASKLAKAAGGAAHALVWSFHGLADDRGLPFRRRLASRLLDKWTDHLAAVCQDSAARYAGQSGIPAERFQVLYNGVDCERFSPGGDRESLRRSLGMEPGTVVAMTAASLTPVKNHLGLLEAAARLAQDGPAPLRFLFLGDGPLRREIEARSEALSLIGRVVLVGASDRIPDYLRAADMFILPSRLEGMSNAILEAMACGLPIVAHDVGGNPELVAHGETGLLCPAGDSKRLADAIRRLAEDAALRRDMGARARGRAVAEFSLEAMMDNYARYYRRVAFGPEPAGMIE